MTRDQTDPLTPHPESSSSRHHSRGTILVVTAIILFALVGLLGLVIDAGQLMTAHRTVHNATDAAATAAAMDLFSGKSSTTAKATAATFVQQYNALPSATVVVNIPPASGPHSSKAGFVETIVTYPVTTRFIQILGVSSTRNVVARAVAGYEGGGGGGDVMLLDPNARPGLDASGSAYLKVNGTVVVNSNGGGNTETGQPINNGNSGSAIKLTGNAKIYAKDVQSVGGLYKDGSASVENYVSGNSQNPLHTGRPVAVDPLLNLPPPTTSNGAVGTTYPAVSLNNVQTATLSPGVYPSIKLVSAAKATFNPGIYIIRGGGLTLTDNTHITGTGVMIYNTGSDYNVNTGLPDSGDMSQTPPATGGATFGAISVAGSSTIRFTPITDPSSPFKGIAYYQRRLNPQSINLSGYTTLGSFRGTIYAKWAKVILTGSANYSSQFIVRSLYIDGGTSITVDTTGQELGSISQVFLVE